MRSISTTDFNGINRRQFIAGLLAAGSGAAAGLTSLAGCSPARRKARIPIGLQLYAVRDEFARDVPGTIAAVGRLGYAGVELWGYGGTPEVYQSYGAKEVRQFLDDNGLKCCGIHLQLRALEDAQLERTIENNGILGNRFLIVAAARTEMSTLEGIKGLAAFLNKAHEKGEAHGMRVGYHAHGFDFVQHEDRFAWDHLFSQTRPEVIMQLDIANSLSGGGDPVAMLRKFPGRALSLHIREYEEKTFASDYYKEVFALAETTGGTEWYVVEQGGEGGRGLVVPAQALEALRALAK